MTSLMRFLPRGRTLVALLLVAALGAAALAWTRDASSTELTARFTSAEGLYVGDDVKVLGVRVGEITGVENDGDGVLVRMKVDAGQSIPADARAAIVSPSLVSGRFVQLSPVFTGGDRLRDGDTIDVERTAVPVTFDDVKQELIDLSTTLGPGRGRKDGPLAEAIRAMDASLRTGNADQLRTSIRELRAAATALADGRSDLFSTISNLNDFTRNLALNDAAVRGFTSELDAVSGVLSANRTSLSGAIRDLAVVLDETEAYFKKHRGRLTEATTDLNTLAATLADKSNELAGVLHVAPHSLIGLHNTVEDQALTGRASLTGFDNLAMLLCGALLGAGGTEEACTSALQPLIGLLNKGDNGGIGLLPNLPGGTR